MSKPTKAHLIASRVPAHPILTLDDPRAAALADQFRNLQADYSMQGVDAVAHAGRVLKQARALMGRLYLSWLRRVPLSRATSVNYIALAELADQHPAQVERHKVLGPTRMYTIAHLLPPKRLEVFNTDGIAEMDDQKFAAVIEKHKTRSRKVTNKMRAHGVGQRLKGFMRKVHATSVPKVKDKAVLASLRGDIENLIKALHALSAKLD